MPRRCTYSVAWGGVPGAPDPAQGGPVRYRCTRDRHLDGDHVVEVGGEQVTLPRNPRGAGRKPTGTETRRPLFGPLYLTEREAEQLLDRAAAREVSAQEAVRTALRLDRLID